MLRVLADAFRYRGPVGGLFVVLVVGLILGVLFVPLLLSSVNPVPLVIMGFLSVLGLALWPLTLRRRNRGNVDSTPIHRWPRLGQNDRSAVRSKLLQSIKPK